MFRKYDMKKTCLNIAATLPMLAAAFLLGTQYNDTPKISVRRHAEGENAFALSDDARALKEHKNAISYDLCWDDAKGYYLFDGKPFKQETLNMSDSEFVYSRAYLYYDFMDPTALNRNDGRIHYPLIWDDALKQFRYNGLAYPFIPPLVRPRFKLDSYVVGFPVR